MLHRKILGILEFCHIPHERARALVGPLLLGDICNAAFAMSLHSRAWRGLPRAEQRDSGYSCATGRPLCWLFAQGSHHADLASTPTAFDSYGNTGNRDIEALGDLRCIKSDNFALLMRMLRLTRVACTLAGSKNVLS
jgi:hypothetical protein